MSDSEFEELFKELRQQPPPAEFAPAAAVRRRGRQRARRQGAAVGVAVLAVIGLGAGSLSGVAGQPVFFSPLAPRAAPAPTEVPDEWPLTGADLGQGWSSTEPDELLAGSPPWFWSSFCVEPGSPVDDNPSLSLRLDVRLASWQNDRWPLPDRVDQVVEVFETTEAAEANLVDIEWVVRHCYRSVKLEVVQTGFGGDESLLVQAEPYSDHWGASGDPHAFRRIAVVRVGGAVTTLVHAGADADVRQLARQAADRLS